MFVLPNGKDNFRAFYLNKENEIQNAVDHIGHGLYNVFKSLGKSPIVKIVNVEISEKVSKRMSQLY